MTTAIVLLASLGFLLSCYALYVRWRVENARRTDHPRRTDAAVYKPLCDISDRISCTKAFLSKAGLTGGLPNPLYGIFFYPFIALLAYDNLPQMLFWASLIAVLVSVYLAYVSYVKQKNFCVVCTAIYLINILLVLFSL